ncbi:MAG: TraR/DksA family transcriptional regulator [Bifidobacteriaceae bacterium]|nr:TraR/DksA family transcriptional regulator [Bifidobacteriaceae bacterium]
MASTVASFDPARIAGLLPTKADEGPWTAGEVEAVYGDLSGDLDRLNGELTEANADLAGLLADSGGAGDDQADTGSRALEREQALSLVNTLQDMIVQTELAIARLVGGTFGVCEACGEPLGKARAQAFPRAMLCVACKQREERR